MFAAWNLHPLGMLLLLVCWSGINTTEEPGQTPPPLDTDHLSTDLRSVVIKGGTEVEHVELLRPISLKLQCTWAGDHNKSPNITGYWKKDGNEIENSHLTLQLENEQYNLYKVFSIASEDNLGNYSCIFDGQTKADFILTVPQIGEKRDKPIVSYVGDSAVITCKMEDNKPLPNTWIWFRANETNKDAINATVVPLRYEVKNSGRKTFLKVNNLTEMDSGSYYCGAVYEIGISMSHAELRVITLLEPLKPFAAIVVEVLVLVTVILLCEKRNSKSNSASGNMVNTDHTDKLTQGESNGMEGESSMRQRKV